MYVGYPLGPAGERSSRAVGGKLPKHQRGPQKLLEVHLPRAAQPSELADHRHRDLGEQRRPE
jgi:hypothetical protein